MVLNDINPSAQKYFEETNEDPQIQFVLEDGKELLKSQKFDLIISNPPYIPRPKSIDDNPYE
jgi:methylase of polypeptide subunit release factors